MITTQPKVTDKVVEPNSDPYPYPLILDNKAFLKLEEICECHKEGITPIFSFRRTFFLDRVRSGEFPKPKKFGRLSLWASSDIKQLIVQMGETA